MPKYSNRILSRFKMISKLLLYNVFWLRQVWPLLLLFISPEQGQPPCRFLNATGMFHHRCQHCTLLTSPTHPHILGEAFPDQPEGNISPSFRIHSHCVICHYDTYYYLTWYFTFTGPCIYYLSLLTNKRMTYLWV